MDKQVKREEAIFTEALRVSAEKRGAFLDEGCRGDDPLREKVEALLKSHEQMGDFLEDASDDTTTQARFAAFNDEKPLDRIGRYTLLQRIGEGGCGIVYLAEQEEPVRRRVALKVIRPGMDTESVIARFEAERQALAMMDHPSIAKVFDAGATDSGRPYFVMELVRGVKMTEYCDQQSLTTRERLKLFVQVCGAIQHAHQKGIIHRDIKPSNILVTTTSEGVALPVVIDFGIAKATTGQQLTDKTIFTACEMLIGTPAYMSPEQALLTGAEADTRTDIYGLGVLLYELLTGATPFDARELLKAGFDEIRRIVCQVEPVRPSTRLTVMAPADRANVSKHHGAEVPKLVREMRGDLDWIVMKALEKDRARRYATANGFAMDIERYLAGEVVLARPPSAAYKFRKLAARNRLLFSGIALIFALLVVSLATTTRWLILERGAREELRLQREVAQLEKAGVTLSFQSKFAEAEQVYRKALDLRRKSPGIDLGAEAPCRILMINFKSEKRLDKIRPLLIEYVDSALLSKGPFVGVFESAIETLGQHGMWDDAAVLADSLKKGVPDNLTHDHMRAPLLVIRGDVDGYRRLCEKLVLEVRRLVSPHVDAAFADSLARNCLIIPVPGLDLKSVAAMADVAVARGSNSSYRCCKSLAEFRLGNFEESVKWSKLAAKSHTFTVQAQALAITAMSQFKLNQLDEARTSLADCDKVIEDKVPKLTKPSFSDLGIGWREWIMTHALQSEAKGMIEPASAAPSRK